MHNSMKLTMALFDSKGLPYKMNEEDNCIWIELPLDNKGSMHVIIHFDDDETVGIRSYEFCSFPNEKKPLMYKTCSDVNCDYRWVKFYVDEEDNTITLADDAVIQIDSCAEEVLELVLRMRSVAQDVYPVFMKAIWS